MTVRTINKQLALLMGERPRFMDDKHKKFVCNTHAPPQPFPTPGFDIPSALCRHLLDPIRSNRKTPDRCALIGTNCIIHFATNTIISGDKNITNSYRKSELLTESFAILNGFV
jgi:hypothetical protein